MDPYIVEAVFLNPKDNDLRLHGTSCAVCASPEEAAAMSINLAMSHGYTFECVLGVALKSDLPIDDNTELDNRLLSNALQRDPQCAALYFPAEGNAPEGSEGSQALGISLGVPDLHKMDS